ncbi:hypothetical protein [Metabacillus malikii]|uniref:Uncharacterized protein n=1 Tax=Metabacillus malikii TaxID=1504265 RepID=A0ABT9ZCH8_9BACI|nr:hypothetical protein [Metabacillus malikii]MDQ0229963.1 hypothetical protein [Metabacillus malikii]
MFSLENDTMLINDREDLIAVLRMRFGAISGDIIEKIYAIDDFSTLQRLILAAANANSWHTFLSELDAGDNSFRIVGDTFNPLGNLKGCDNHNES